MLEHLLSVVSLFLESKWIGLTDRDVELQFLWEPIGELLTWSNWYGDQGYSSFQDCVNAYGMGKWYDVQCFIVRYPLCELPEN